MVRDSLIGPIRTSDLTLSDLRVTVQGGPLPVGAATRKTAIVSFIVSFGVTKALLNLVAARLSERVGRKPILVAGWQPDLAPHREPM
jgi:hypothetical protein